MRYEIKFVLPETFLHSVYNKILTSQYFFSEIFKERRINNIYLDTPTYDNLYDNLNGFPSRTKHRIRWYGGDSEVGDPILEYKIKKGQLGYKKYYSLPGFKFDINFNYDNYLEKIGKIILGHNGEYKIMLGDIRVEIPTLYNTFQRRYFLSGNGKFRITADRNITYKGVDRRFSNAYSFSQNNIVVELKFDDVNIGGAPGIIQELGFRISRNSKYVIGMRGIYFNIDDQD